MCAYSNRHTFPLAYLYFVKIGVLHKSYFWGTGETVPIRIVTNSPGGEKAAVQVIWIVTHSSEKGDAWKEKRNGHTWKAKMNESEKEKHRKARATNLHSQITPGYIRWSFQQRARAILALTFSYMLLYLSASLHSVPLYPQQSPSGGALAQRLRALLSLVRSALAVSSGCTSSV